MRVGDKATGFKFDDGTNSIAYWDVMDEYIGREGVVTQVGSYYFIIEFEKGCTWSYPICKTELTPQKDEHYNNEKGSLYLFAEQHGLNAWEFDILKRVVRCRKKGHFIDDLEKTKRVIDLYLKEYNQ
jgi:hypothetical protein